MPWVPPAASATLRFISFVVAVCSSTAVAMVDWKSLISPMTVLIRLIASTAPAVSAWMASTRWEMSSVARAVSCASSLTSLATTAKPLPASPARAASMVAFSASRLVCSAMPLISFTTVAISCEESPSFPTVLVVASATLTAWPATREASLALREISRIAASICREPVATVSTLEATSSAEATTRPACPVAVRALSAMPTAPRVERLRGRRQPPRRVAHQRQHRAQRVQRGVQRAGDLADLRTTGVAGADAEVAPGDPVEHLLDPLHRAHDRPDDGGGEDDGDDQAQADDEQRRGAGRGVGVAGLLHGDLGSRGGLVGGRRDRLLDRRLVAVHRRQQAGDLRDRWVGLQLLQGREVRRHGLGEPAEGVGGG